MKSMPESSTQEVLAGQWPSGSGPTATSNTAPRVDAGLRLRARPGHQVVQDHSGPHRDGSGHGDGAIPVTKIRNVASRHLARNRRRAGGADMCSPSLHSTQEENISNVENARWRYLGPRPFVTRLTKLRRATGGHETPTCTPMSTPTMRQRFLHTFDYWQACKSATTPVYL
jgi:hypothetical protein